MSFDWPDYIEVANTLKGFGLSNTYPTFTEALYRAAISRAYYAAFKKAEEFLNTHPRFRKYYIPGQYSETSHMDVINDFGDSNKNVNGEFYIVNDKLIDLKFLRQQADYKIPFRVHSGRNLIIAKNLAGTTYSAVNDAKTVLNRITYLETKYP